MLRNEETLEASTYANRLPDDLSGRQCYVLDPMLATGGTLADGDPLLIDRGADDITAICLLAAPEGIEHLEEELADLDVADHRRHRRHRRAAQREGLHRARARRRRRPALRPGLTCRGMPRGWVPTAACGPAADYDRRNGSTQAITSGSGSWPSR